MLPNEVYNAVKTLQCIEKYKCTAIYGVPTMFVTEMEQKEFEQTDRSTIKFGIIAGAAMPPELLRRIVRPVHDFLARLLANRDLNRSTNSPFRDSTPAGA